MEGEEIRGVVLSRIVERRPDLKRELGILRQALLQENEDGGEGSSEEELKVYTPPFGFRELLFCFFWGGS